MFIDNVKNLIKDNKKKIIILLIILLCILIYNLITKENGTNKLYSNEKYVYEYETYSIEEYTSKMPYINLKGSDVKEINNSIMTTFYTKNIVEDEYMDYEYYVNDNILSVIVKLYSVYGDNIIPNTINFYNFNINTTELLSNEEILNLYDIDISYVEDKMINYIEEYYNYEKDNNYINNDFASYQDIIDYSTTNNNYYVKDNNLYVYNNLSLDIDFIYDQDKPFELFRFKIK